MLIVSSFSNPNIIINKEEIDNALCYGGLSFEEKCKRNNFDYELFKRIYNNDLNVTLKELIKFSRTFEIALSDFVILS
ncbi:MAG: hypothetical protein IJ371_00295 [Clostridia bacterium]|nr:hypothetical protein [Clostridia bacterium]